MLKGWVSFFVFDNEERDEKEMFMEVRKWAKIELRIEDWINLMNENSKGELKIFWNKSIHNAQRH